ncbi:cation efflux system protein czcD [Mollisia scopiformis]|uniref:Cation efflux system protein czcD n=1 Tax=Mollisia scopiformis TaxID=149040 RepID=A0A194WWT9_MOLSC|nr:cation efflux system protein czcD [Mollisia scopiformis]KUJ12052.1 cation efflux system protein czcD [Mollisia scopiformis]
MALEKSTRLMIIIAISFSFFVGEISVGFYTHSLALVADAFHYMNDLVGFIVALVATQISKRENSPKELSFGWQRAQLLGAFFNGVFLLALGVSIFLQSVERFISLQKVENPMLVLIMGCVGLTLNIISAAFLHEHDHGPKVSSTGTISDDSNMELSDTNHPHKDHRHINSTQTPPGRDLGLLGVMIHVISDAINNLGVILSSAIIWKLRSPSRYYADPSCALFIALMILLSSLPLVSSSGRILLESVPLGVSLDDIKHDLEKVSGVLSIHELHAWRLSQHKALASAHVLVGSESLSDFMRMAGEINECLHAYGIHSTTLQPELVGGSASASKRVRERVGAGAGRRGRGRGCRVNCGMECEELSCCG